MKQGLIIAVFINILPFHGNYHYLPVFVIVVTQIKNQIISKTVENRGGEL